MWCRQASSRLLNFMPEVASMYTTELGRDLDGTSRKPDGISAKWLPKAANCRSVRAKFLAKRAPLGSTKRTISNWSRLICATKPANHRPVEAEYTSMTVPGPQAERCRNAASSSDGWIDTSSSATHCGEEGASSSTAPFEGHMRPEINCSSVVAEGVLGACIPSGTTAPPTAPTPPPAAATKCWRRPGDDAEPGLRGSPPYTCAWR
mmetsp:Transcript_23407/g.66241  ORF Transcript_23407/g.66241 Transcript_23407/m.66241 type:complete len:206 (+) Transcript_23407:192-809(+)